MYARLPRSVAGILSSATPSPQQCFGVIQTLAAAGQGHQVDPGRCEIRVHVQRLAVLLHGLRVMALALHQHRQVEPPTRQVGITPQALLVVGKRSGERCAAGFGKLCGGYIGQGPHGFIARTARAGSCNTGGDEFQIIFHALPTKPPCTPGSVPVSRKETVDAALGSLFANPFRASCQPSMAGLASLVLRPPR